MKIADRYRQLTRQSGQLAHTFALQPDGVRIDRAVRLLEKAHAELAEWNERVGEIPQIHLEARLSPVLLHVHTTLDRGRVLYEDVDKSDEASTIWDLEQQIYRLLNDL